MMQKYRNLNKRGGVAIQMHPANNLPQNKQNFEESGFREPNTGFNTQIKFKISEAAYFDENQKEVGTIHSSQGRSRRQNSMQKK